jgi:hypothetical protein
MKPIHNKVYCPIASKFKQLFESESKAMNSIKFNKDDFDDKNHVPCRAYYCEACGGWHLTSLPSYNENSNKRIQFLRERSSSSSKLLDELAEILESDTELTEDEISKCSELLLRAKRNCTIDDNKRRIDLSAKFEHLKALRRRRIINDGVKKIKDILSTQYSDADIQECLDVWNTIDGLDWCGKEKTQLYNDLQTAKGARKNIT